MLRFGSAFFALPCPDDQDVAVDQERVSPLLENETSGAVFLMGPPWSG